VSRIRAFWIASISGVLVLSACASQVDEMRRLQARAAYDRGLKAFEEKLPSPALAAFQEAIGLDDTVPTYRNAIGVLLVQLGRPGLAIEHFARAVEIDPEYAEGFLNLGIALAEIGQWEAAVAAYRQALTKPTLAHPETAHHSLGVALYNLKRYREAEESLRFAIGLEPATPLPYYNLGLVFMAESRKDDAKGAFRRAVELAPNSAYGQAAREKLRLLDEGG